MPSPTSWSRAAYVTLSGSQTVDALLGDTKWVSSNLTYSFPGYVSTWSTDTATGYGPSDSGTEPWNISFAPLSASNQIYFAAALQQWANVANLQFAQVADTSTSVGDIRVAFGYVSSFANAQAWSTTPGSTSRAGDVWFNSIGSSAIESWAPGSFSFYTALHELGHVLGFKHPFYEAGSSGAVLPSSLDTGQYTVMSYTEPPNDLFRTITYNANGSITLYTDHVSPETPMVLDIAAMQYLYGANTTYNTGDDVYSFDPAAPFFRTIWDAGGNDTVSVGNFSQDCVIDLTPGNYSSIKILPEPIPAGYTVVGGLTPTYDGTNNLGIAYGAIIENAAGGSGNDTLIGNDADNCLDGGAGNDTAFFSGAYAQSTLTKTSTGWSVAGANGTDTLINIENVSFSDKTVPLVYSMLSGLEYIASYPDLIWSFGANAEAGASHYIQYGLNEGRTTTFDGLEYIASYPDLIWSFGANAEAGASHYIQYGLNEGRATTFDGLEYIASYPDLIWSFGANAEAGASHYIQYGLNEGRTTTFDGFEYIASYPDLMGAFGSNAEAGTIHYIQFGFNEGRKVATQTLADANTNTASVGATFALYPDGMLPGDVLDGVGNDYLNGDGKSGILRSDAGQVSTWNMDGVGVAGAADSGVVTTDWYIHA